MIYNTATPRNYTDLLDATCAVSLSTLTMLAFQIVGYQRVTFGDYGSGAAGVQVNTKNHYKIVSGAWVADNFVADLVWHGVTVASVTLTGFQATYTSLLKFNGVLFSSSLGGGYNFSATNIEWWFNGVLVYTIPSPTEASGDYDPGKNQSYQKATARFDAEPTPSLPGGLFYARTTSGSDSLSASIELKPDGWQDDRTGSLAPELIDLDTTIAYPNDTCGPCDSSLPSLGTVTSPPQYSNDVDLTAAFTRTISQSYLGTFTCNVCPDGQITMNPSTWETYQLSWSYEEKWDEIWIAPEDAGILDHYYEGRDRCADALVPGWEETPHNVISSTHHLSHTKCQYDQNTFKFYGTRGFGILLHNGSCPLTEEEGGGGSPQNCVDALPKSLCVFDGRREIVWITLPPSGGGATDFDITDSQQAFRATIDGSAMVNVGTSGNTLPYSFSNNSCGFAADTICVRYDRESPTQRVYMVYDLSGSVYETWTDNEGLSTSSPRMISSTGSAKKPGFVFARHRTRYIYWQDSGQILYQHVDDGGNILASGVAIASGVDDSEVRVDERVLGSGEHQIALSYISVGSLKVAFSPDGKTFSGTLTLGSATHPALVCTRHKIMSVLGYNAGAIDSWLIDEAGNTVRSGTGIASGVDDLQIAVDERVLGNGRHNEVLMFGSAGTVTEKHSDDCIVFS